MHLYIFPENIFMIKVVSLVITSLIALPALSQGNSHDSAVLKIKMQKDSALQAAISADSGKIEKEYAEKLKEARLKNIAIYPVLNAGDNSGVIPVKDPTEIPDPKLTYKLLIELVQNNPDSLVKDPNQGLVEVARIINLHVASGIPLKNIIPVIVIHAGALNAIITNEAYKEKFKMDNPNLKLINELEKIGTKIIACGQAMEFFDVKREALLPSVKISLTAQTVISSYQLKGFVKYW
jgi:intracellular sulfur oxidation DsrE/DsrF family protein